MKLIVYVLSALLLLSCVSAGDSSKQDVDTSELQNDSHLQDALKYGCNWIFEQAANKYGISNSDIQVNQVNTIQKWEDNGNTYYSFDVEAENNDATITCQFNVKCDKDGKLSVVNKWNYNIDQKNKEEQSDSYNTETEVETYDAGTNVEINVEVDVETTVETTVEEQEEEEDQDQVEEVTNKCQQGDEVDASEVDNDSHLKDALNYGINWIYKKAADKYGISDSGITVNQINCICKWEDNGKTYYYFDVNTDNNDANVNATYNVKCDSDGTFDVVNKWSYTIDKNTNQEETDGYDTEEDNNDDSHDIEVDIEVTVNEEENDNNKCKDIDVSEVDNDSHLKDALIHGITWIFGKAHDKFGISNSDLVVTKINSICGYEENGNTYYSFDVEATNKDGDTVDTTYNVKCESDGNLRVVNEWKYVIHYHDTNEQETENCDNTEDQGSYTNEENSQDIEVDVEITVEEEENTNKCEQGDEVDASEIDNDSALKDALVYGADWIFQNAANKYGVSDSTVQVTQVNCICRWEDNGKTYYSFDVEANNNDDASVDATFNVKDDGSGNLDVVNKWKYHIDYKTKKNQDKSDDCDSTEDQGTDSYENDEQDVEVDVEVNIEVNHDNDQEDCEEEDNNTDNNNDDYSK